MAAKPTPTASISPKLQPQKQGAMVQNEKRIDEVLSFPILLADQITIAVREVDSFISECSEVGKQVDHISKMLRAAVRMTTSPSSGASFYDRPLRRIVTEVTKNLDKALILIKKCKERGIFLRVVTIVTTADFRKLLSLLDSSVADLKWVMDIFESEDTDPTLPDIANNDPILPWVWSCIASLHMGQLQAKTEAANKLASLANDNDRNKLIIVDEGGLSPLLKLLKDSSSVDGQIAAASALINLATDEVRIAAITVASGISIIVHVLRDSAMKVQIKVARLVAKMAGISSVARDDFARENVIRPLVSLLSFDQLMEDSRLKDGKQSIHSIVQINKEMDKKDSKRPGFGTSLSMHYSDGSSKNGGSYRKERENEKPEVKHELKVNCAEALWMLAKGSVENSRRITETKGLLSLANLVETEQGELQINCLMTIMEITSAAEYNVDLRRSTFKTNSPTAKAVVNQLLRIIKECNDPTLQISAIRSIGSLARTFPERDTRFISTLLKQLNHGNVDIATEIAASLGKFASPDNYLCVEHCKNIIELGGVPPLMKLLRMNNEKAQLQGLKLVCYLAINAGKSKDLERAGVPNAILGVGRALVAQYPELKELTHQAIYHLSMFHQSHSGLLVQKAY